MFGAKKNPNPSEKTEEGMPQDIGIIPDIFYGGNDPEIYNEKESVKKEGVVSAQKQASSSPVEEKPAVPVRTSMPRRLPPPPLPTESVSQPPVPETQKITQPVPAPAKKGSGKTIVIVLLVVLILGGGAFAAWYFFFRSSESAPQVSQNTEVVTPPVTEQIPPSTLPQVEPPVETPPVEVLTPTSSIVKERSLPIVSFLTVVDSDNDKLTAPEEEIFQTDPETFDSDNDGYYDGQEVFNLYNPKGFAPMKIIDSGLVQEYVNPSFQYRIYFPVEWKATPIDERDNKQVLFSSITGDYIEVKAYDKLVGESFPGWFGRVVGDQIYTDLTSGTNRFSVPFYRRKDGLVSYFETPTALYIVIYYSHDEKTNDFPHVMDMMVQSFRPAKSTTDLPAQRIIPSEGETTVSPETSISTSSER